tara:strand:- start:827 stop:4903 length:4077 start_codon:yes stop_codon:yes gene_type:complete
MAVKNFSDRIFGTNIPPKVYNKLVARQIFATNSYPGQSLESVGDGLFQKDWYGGEYKKPSLKEALGYTNFTSPDTEISSIADLSSRTPWVRMWTAVEFYKGVYVGEMAIGLEVRQDSGNAAYDKSDAYTDKIQAADASADLYQKNISDKFVVDKEKNWKYIEQAEVKSEEFNRGLERHIYMLGNHEFTQFTQANDINNPLSAETTLANVADPQENFKFPNQLEDNTFMRPAAGITSVSSTTDGALGAIKKTTVNFIVHNLRDYEDIYLKYFLVPGAKLFLDFGWDTSGAYDPAELIKATPEKELLDRIYGTQGIIDIGNGDLDVIYGQVVNYESKQLKNGSYECMVEIVSENAALLDKEISKTLQSVFDENIYSTLLKVVHKLIGNPNDLPTMDLLNKAHKQGTTDYETVTMTNNYAKSWFSSLVSGKVNEGRIPEEEVKLGLYWQAVTYEPYTPLTDTIFDIQQGETTLSGQGGGTTQFTGMSDEWESTSQQLELGEDIETLILGNVSSDSENVFISWGFFEEELLNRYLAFYKTKENDKDGIMYTNSGEDYNYNQTFNSSLTIIPINKNLVERQHISPFHTGDKTSRKFLYPEKSGGSSASGHGFSPSKSYYSIHFPERYARAYNTWGSPDFSTNPWSNIPNDIQVDSSSGIDLPVRKISNKIWKYGCDILIDEYIPLTELFINIDLIKRAFNINNNISDAIKFILDEINQDSLEILDLQLFSPNTGDTQISVVDRNNMPPVDGDGGKKPINNFLANMFTFETHSPGSMIKDLSIDYRTPDNGISSMIAIQNTSLNLPVLGSSRNEEMNKQIRDIMRAYAAQGQGKFLGIRYLPVSLTDFTNRDDAQRRLDIFETGGRLSNSSLSDLSNNASFKNGEYKNLTNRLLRQVGNSNVSTAEKVQYMQNPDLISIPVNKLSKLTQLNLKYGAAIEAVGDESESDSWAGKQNYTDTLYAEELSPVRVVDDIMPQNLYAKDIEDYYDLKLKMDDFKRISTIFPITVELQIYGISSLNAGDCFMLDFLPKQWRNEVYFQILKVGHDISNSGWTTKLETVMRLWPNKKGAISENRSPKILLHPGFFDNVIRQNVGKWFFNFELVDFVDQLDSDVKKLAGEMMVFQAKARMEGQYDWGNQLGEFHYEQSTISKIVETANPQVGVGVMANVSNAIMVLAQYAQNESETINEYGLTGSYVTQYTRGFEHHRCWLRMFDEGGEFIEYYLVLYFGAVLVIPKNKEIKLMTGSTGTGTTYFDWKKYTLGNILSDLLKIGAGQDAINTQKAPEYKGVTMKNHKLSPRKKNSKSPTPTGVPCLGNDDCPSGTCENGECVEQSQYQYQAPSGNQCFGNDDCDAGDICQAGQCV